MNKRICFAFTMSLFCVGLSHAKTIDLTHSFDEKTIYWPTERGYQRETIFFGKTPKNYFYSAFKFCAPEHGGTHIDAPIHFFKSGLTVDEIPLDALMGNAVVIDVSASVQNNSDYLITKEDILTFEKHHRQLNSKDIVLFHTGWSKFWTAKRKYLGTDKLGDVANLHFPGVSKEAAIYLLQQNVKGLGIDTASMDAGQSQNFPVHRHFLAANKYGLENLVNLEQLPVTGAQLIVAPMKIKGGSGAPTRVFAII